MNIPVTDSMFHSTWNGVEIIDYDSEGKPISGFDPSNLYVEHTRYFSVFDIYRLEMAMLPFLKSYGYEPKYYDGQEFSNEEKLFLLKLPYITESIKTIVPPQVKAAHKQNALRFINITLSIKQFPFKVNTIEGDCYPLMWLRPKEELLETPLYKTRIRNNNPE